jgi:Tol biopolymer transport system component
MWSHSPKPEVRSSVQPGGDHGTCMKLIGSLFALFATVETVTAQQCSVELMSVSPTAGGGNGESGRTGISADGLVVAFGSNADNLVPGDGNANADIFVRDRTTSTTALISCSTAGGQANGASGFPRVSGDGRFVVFRSWATNLDPADIDPKPDIYRHDRVTGETVLVSHHLVPATHPEGAWQSSISYDGRFVAFDCWDDNLVPGDVNGMSDVYLRDMQTGVMELVSVGNQGEIGSMGSDTPSISWDGRYVSFASRATNWFAGNPHFFPHIYVRDRVLGTTTLVSYSPSGSYGPVGGGFQPSISGNGAKVAFMYLGPDLMPSLFTHQWRGAQVYIRDLVSGELTYIGYSFKGGLSGHESHDPMLSYDGRFVAWDSYSKDLILTNGPGAQVFHRDLETGVTVLVGKGMGGAQPDGFSADAAISGDGRTVVFCSQASNLVPGSTGGTVNIFVRECDVASPTVYCKAKVGVSGCEPDIGFQGKPSATAGSGFLIRADQLVGAQPSFVLYSTRPAYVTSGFTVLLCLAKPANRTPPISSAGTAGICDGTIAFDMNAWIASGIDPTLQAGSPAYSQVWCRDPAGPVSGTLSDAVAFLIGP